MVFFSLTDDLYMCAIELDIYLLIIGESLLRILYSSKVLKFQYKSSKGDLFPPFLFNSHGKSTAKIGLH
jgi:hypothetical protein